MKVKPAVLLVLGISFSISVWAQKAPIAPKPQTPSSAQIPATPQGYSLKNGKLFVSVPVGSSNQPTTHAAILDAANTSNQCPTASIPTTSQETQTDDNFYSYSLDEAASLKIQVPIVSGGGSGNGTEKVFMRQYKRYGTCTAPSGQIVEYGHALRATVLYDSTQLQGDVNFPMLVASATLNKQTTQIDLQNTGFTDTTVITPRAAAIASLTGGALTIDNYGIFMGKLGEAMSAADTSSNGITAGQRNGVSTTPVILGFEVSVDSPDSNLPDSLARALAIQYIANGSGCFQAQDDFSKTDQHARNIVKDTYLAITKACAAPSDIDKVVAATMLHGMKVTKPKSD